MYGYDYGTVTSRIDLFERSLAWIENRLALLVPQRVHKIPILIGGMGVRRTLPIVAKHADIWHTFASVQEYRRKNAMLKDLVREAGRDERQIEVHPTDYGYDFSEFKDMIAWRDRHP